jgi:transcriptional regulator with XRE-family HTH domain
LEALRRIRTMRGMNQVDLARASGVAQNTISEIELGKREARPGTLKKLADALGVEISDFFGEAHPLGPAPPETQEYGALLKDGVPARANRVVAGARQARQRSHRAQARADERKGFLRGAPRRASRAPQALPRKPPAERRTAEERIGVKAMKKPGPDSPARSVTPDAHKGGSSLMIPDERSERTG